jgi:hypothetical protein
MCLPEPTPTPTIAVAEESFEVIPLTFFFQDIEKGQLPVQELKAAMIAVLRQILDRLPGSVPALSISNVEGKFYTRTLLRGAEGEDRHLRKLEENIILYFNVELAQDVNGRKFTPVVIQAIADSYPEIIDHLR